MQSQFFQIPCYFELIRTISLGFALQSSTIGYFELSLFRTAFRFPWEFEIGVVNNLVLIWQEHNVSTILSTYNSILILLADSYNCQYLTVLTVWVIYASKSNREKKKIETLTLWFHATKKLVLCQDIPVIHCTLLVWQTRYNK